MLSVARIVVSLSFGEHGTQKVLNFPAGHGTPPTMSLLGIAGLLELIGGGLMLLGLFTRPVAFILAGEMAVAYFMQHAPHGLYPVVNKGEPAILYCFLFLVFVFTGPGTWSLDQLIKQKAK